MEVNRYGKTDSEKEAEQMFQCRQIVQEILKFGVNQKQLLRIIKLLSLELDDRKALEAVTNAVKSIETAEEASTKIIT